MWLYYRFQIPKKIKQILQGNTVNSYVYTTGVTVFGSCQCSEPCCTVVIFIEKKQKTEQGPHKKYNWAVACLRQMFHRTNLSIPVSTFCFGSIDWIKHQHILLICFKAINHHYLPLWMTEKK